MPQKPNTNFETSLNELNKIVEQMEKGELTLEEALKQFEKGICLTRDCQTVLNEATQKVEILMQKNNATSLESFEIDDETKNENTND